MWEVCKLGCHQSFYLRITKTKSSFLCGFFMPILKTCCWNKRGKFKALLSLELSAPLQFKILIFKRKNFAVSFYCVLLDFFQVCLRLCFFSICFSLLNKWRHLFSPFSLLYFNFFLMVQHFKTDPENLSVIKLNRKKITGADTQWKPPLLSGRF